VAACCVRTRRTIIDALKRVIIEASLKYAGMVRPETRKARPPRKTGLQAEVEADALTAGVS